MNRQIVSIGFLLLSTAAILPAETTVDATDRFGYLPNGGWVDWYGDGTDGAAFANRFASGYIWSANLGWIHLGDGTPDNGTAYSNTSATDYGINIDATSDPAWFLLSGYAWGANVGWINFDFPEETWGPRIDRQTGIASGYAWGANIGWVRLDTMESILNTGLIADEENVWMIY